MTPQAQRIAIAEACGWVLKIPEHTYTFRVWHSPSGRVIELGPPDYSTDLNAMHEAEKELTGAQADEYADALFVITYEQLSGDRHWATNKFFACHATAAQRAEAFLRTLNLWDDSK